jgi:dTDP-4-dehydrorhamnose reductase
MSKFCQQILLLGKNGMFGQAIYDLVSLSNQVMVTKKTLTWSDKLTRSNLIAWDRKELDITQQDQVIKKISELKPDIIINATGYTDVDGAEKESKLAFAVNADGVKYIAQVCSQINAILIHFSTDYIFDGSQPNGYVENDVNHIGPVNVYGKSKLAGEEKIKSQISNLKNARLPSPKGEAYGGQANQKSKIDVVR